MDKGHRKCEVCGINERHHENLLFSSFPLEPNCCREWLKQVGKEDLVYLPIEKLHMTRNVCANHFEEKHFNKKRNRIKRNAIPSLKLMATPLAETLFKEFPQHLRQPTEPKESTPSVITLKKTDVLSEAEPSTSQQGTCILGKLYQNERTHPIHPSRPQKRPGDVIKHKAKLVKLSQDNFNFHKSNLKELTEKQLLKL